MNEPSTLFGVSVRAIIALVTVVASFAFLFGVAFGIGGEELVVAAMTIVGTTLGLVVGFYFGQKGAADGS